MAWLTGWQYRKQITISGEEGAGTNYQVLLKVGESSGATGADFNIEGKSSIFPSDKNVSGDLRFTASDGTTLLDFWVESVTGTSPNRVAKVWVKVSADLGSNQTIYCYYGNANATSASSGDNTFLFFDDFDGTSYDTNKWNAPTGGSVSVSNSILAFTTSSSNDFLSKISVSQGCAFRAKNKITSSLNSSHMCSARASDWNNRVDQYCYDSTTMTIETWANGSKTDSQYSFSDWTNYHIFENQWSSNQVKYLYDDTVKITHTTNVPTINLAYCFRIPGNYIYSDWVLVRKYVSPEPAFSSAGSLESSPPSSSFFMLLDGNIS